jgi:chemotaxis protein histidine kinase CheA
VSDADALIASFRTRFRENAVARLDEMRALCDQLEREPGEATARVALARHFHFFAGMGATCGFPDVSALGADAERSFGEAATNREDVSAWRAALVRIEQALAG